MKQFTIFVIFFILLILSSTSTQAFDGKRKGFVLSGGVGLTKYLGKLHFKNEISENAYTYGFTIGYGINENNIIVFDRGINTILFKDNHLVDHDAGFSWFHYYHKQKKSFYSKIGIGHSPEAIYFGGGYIF